MSFYATIQGTLKYKTKEAFDAAKKRLEDGNWINEDGMFLDENCNVIDDGTMELNVNPKDMTITIPYFCHRNLSRLLDDITDGTEGIVVWTSTDGCFDGGVFEDGKETAYDLAKWNKENGGEEGPDADKDFDNWCEWANEVENDFHDTFI